MALIALLLGLLSLILLGPGAGQAGAKELRRSMSYIRPYLMGDAYVAVADEASIIFYNPAAIVALIDSSVELLNPLINVDKRIKDAIVNPDSLNEEFADVSEDDLRSLAGENIFVNINTRLPAIVRPHEGLAYGLGAEVLASVEILGNPVLPGMQFEFFYDQVMFVGMAWRVGDNFAWGITPKVIKRVGVAKKYTFGELFAAGGSLNLDNDPAYQDAQNGVAFQEYGLDVGFLYRFRFWDIWKPRMGLSLLNIGGTTPEHNLGGMEFGPRPAPYDPPQAGELPQINTIGFAVSPIVSGIRYTIAFDYVDFTQTALPGDDWKKRTRLGFEMGIGPREDGTALLSFLAGFNATHPSFGLLSRVWIFEVGFGTYTVELGDSAGDRPAKRAMFLFGFHF